MFLQAIHCAAGPPIKLLLSLPTIVPHRVGAVVVVIAWFFYIIAAWIQAVCCQRTLVVNGIVPIGNREEPLYRLQNPVLGFERWNRPVIACILSTTVMFWPENPCAKRCRLLCVECPIRVERLCWLYLFVSIRSVRMLKLRFIFLLPVWQLCF